MNEGYLNFDEYIRQGEPAQLVRANYRKFGKGIMQTDNPLIRNLVMVIGNGQCSIKEMLKEVGLKDRKNFLEYHLNPSISEGYVRLLYPQSPRHPRQKYLLTMKGLMLYKEMTQMSSGGL